MHPALTRPAPAPAPLAAPAACHPAARPACGAARPPAPLRPALRPAAAAGGANGAPAAPAAPFPPQATAQRPAASAARASGPCEPAYMANLLVRCPDAKGVVASLAQLLYGMNCNIITSDQFSDIDEGQFYQRISLDYSDLLVGPGNTAVLEHGIREVSQRFDMVSGGV